MTESFGKIKVVTTPEAEERYLPGGKRATAAVVAELDVEALRTQLARLAQQIDHVIDGVETKGALALDEVKVGIEITASGGVHLVGKLEVEGKAALELTFKRA